MIREAIAKLVNGDSLSYEEAAASMEMIMTGEATPAQVGSFLTALRMKGESVDEVAGLAQVMREKATVVHPPATLNRPLVDVVGTGGDGKHTFNISTTAAFVIAGAGAAVAKHGNRAASSRCGSADVLEALGVNINLKPEQVAACIEKAGIGFMFAPLFHPSMKYAGPVRREIGIRTVFNILGPLTNPARVRRQLLGVPDPTIAAKMAAVLKRLGCDHAIVACSSDGMDEISIAASSHLYEVRADGNVHEQVIKPEDFGFKRAELDTMVGGTAEQNREITLRILQGEKGAQRDVVLLNAAAALMAADLAGDMWQGIKMSAQSIDSGAAYASLNSLVAVSQSFAA
jgi:anthranilate phosphoribosyltransferase